MSLEEASEQNNSQEDSNLDFEFAVRIADIFKSLKIENSEGVSISLVVQEPEKELSGFEEKEVVYRVRLYFEVNNQIADTEENHVLLMVYPNKEIYISHAELKHPLLRGKNIYPQIINLIGEHLPGECKIISAIEREPDKSVIDIAKENYLKAEFENKEHSLAKLKEAIQKSYLVKLRIAAHFNRIIVQFRKYNTYPRLIAFKDKDTKSNNIDVEFIGYENDQ